MWSESNGREKIAKDNAKEKRGGEKSLLNRGNL
jgi:hypothetical protein